MTDEQKPDDQASAPATDAPRSESAGVPMGAQGEKAEKGAPAADSTIDPAEDSSASRAEGGQGDTENPKSADEMGAADSGDDVAENPADVEVETTYQATTTGHRITRRTVKRKRTTEEVEEDVTETITEDLPVVYQAPRSAHPAPVG